MVTMAWKLHAVLESACVSAGDVSLPAYALLVGAFEKEQGLPLKVARARFDALFGFDCLASVLEQRELTERVRNADNRREFALCATRRGVAHVERVDGALALGIIGYAHDLTETTFEQLVGRMSSLASQADGVSGTAALFPSMLLRALCAYHEIAVRESLLLGMSSLQAALLCAVDAEEGVLQGAARWPVAESILEQQFDELRGKGLVDAEGAALSEEGIARADAFCHGVRARLGGMLDARSEAFVDELCDLCDFAIYALM